MRCDIKTCSNQVLDETFLGGQRNVLEAFPRRKISVINCDTFIKKRTCTRKNINCMVICLRIGLEIQRNKKVFLKEVEIKLKVSCHFEWKISYTLL